MIYRVMFNDTRGWVRKWFINWRGTRFVPGYASRVRVRVHETPQAASILFPHRYLELDSQHLLFYTSTHLVLNKLASFPSASIIVL